MFAFKRICHMVSNDMSLSACGTILDLQSLLCPRLTSHTCGTQMRKSMQFDFWRHEKAPIYIFCSHLFSEFIPSLTIEVKRNNPWRNHLPKVFIVFHEALPLLRSRMALWREGDSADREPRPLQMVVFDPLKGQPCPGPGPALLRVFPTSHYA